MLSNCSWYHIENIYSVISVFRNLIFAALRCKAHAVNHLLSFCLFSCCWQPTSRKSWPTSSPSYWTARQRSKASTTLPSSPPTPPWSCVKDSAASWPFSAGCPPKGDELGGTARHLSFITGPTLGRNPWTSLNPCLPYESRGHSLLAVIPLLLFCCYRFYHYKYYFKFILSKTQRRKEEERTDCWEGIKKWDRRSWWKNSGNPAVVESQAHCASALQKKQNKTKKELRVFIVYYCCCCCLIQASPNTLITLSKAPLSAWKGSPCCSASSLVQYYHVLFYFSKEVRKRAFRFISGSEYLNWVSCLCGLRQNEMF